MDLRQRIVTQIPLNEIWTADTVLSAKRSMYLTEADIKRVLKNRLVRFVIADVGEKLEWIDFSECHDFWKNRLRGRVLDNSDKIDLDKFADNYAFTASEWTQEVDETLILLEKVH